MKVKITKIKSAKDLSERLAGVGTFRITGKGPDGKRRTIDFEGTRKQAEQKAPILLEEHYER